MLVHKIQGWRFGVRLNSEFEVWSFVVVNPGFEVREFTGVCGLC